MIFSLPEIYHISFSGNFPNMMGNLSPSAANMNFNANFLNQQMQRGGSVLLVSNLSEEVRNKFKLNCFFIFQGRFYWLWSSQTSKMESFATILNYWNPVTVVAKLSDLDNAEVLETPLGRSFSLLKLLLVKWNLTQKSSNETVLSPFYFVFKV